ncbi:oxidoreductase [Microbacterium ulmi]|uniref:SDR family oxidoreductase n=1 Tax=Microbacterium ulmi TaxID=179095 RepID=A0A7Y2M064_9MICO|nr:oxidoreductase [Microbacterium ulmi]NII69354.1 NAD(P)-dependent dehydrogenase (short-subunit alcohol dehydrogenase family) [Microbacterium ulmi]NNH04034.1 SDR family oxidoreductase [Microbacterium ulmi]
MTAWSAADIPDQTGRTAIVTGANSGLGLVTATELARHGASVVLAVRNTAAGEDAARAVRELAPRSELVVRAIDLASLASVRDFAAQIADERESIDLLVNNAGAQNLGPRRTTVDGYEFHLGTNLLGHFALTGLLLPTLSRGADPRVVSLSSITHKRERLDFDDLQLERSFSPMHAYGASKLATTTFGIELDRRLRAAGSPVGSVLAHPGLARSSFIEHAWEDRGVVGRTMGRLFSLVATQPTERGALPQLYAATARGVQSGQFFGPDGRGERRGDVTAVRASRTASDPVAARQLWSVAEALTGVTYLSSIARLSGESRD